MIKIKLSGVEQLKAALRRLPEAMGRKTVSQAVSESLVVLRDEARLQAPEETGALKQSINYATVKGKDGKDVKGRVYVQRSRLKKDQGRDVFYATFMEFGFMQRDGTRHPGFGFMRRAFETQAEKSVRTFEDASARRLKDAVTAAK